MENDTNVDPYVPRTFTTLVAESPDPDSVIEDVERVLDGSYSFDRQSPRVDSETRVRIEGGGWFHDELKRAIAAGTVAPIEWAVVMNHMDEAVGVNAWVYDGRVLVDEFEGDEGGEGADTELYLERYHDVVVDSCGPYRPAPNYDPDAALSDVEAPAETLADR